MIKFPDVINGSFWIFGCGAGNELISFGWDVGDGGSCSERCSERCSELFARLRFLVCKCECILPWNVSIFCLEMWVYFALKCECIYYVNVSVSFDMFRCVIYVLICDWFDFWSVFICELRYCLWATILLILRVVRYFYRLSVLNIIVGHHTLSSVKQHKAYFYRVR